MSYEIYATITRPANTTAYTAGDVVGGAFQFSGVPGGKLLMVTTAWLLLHFASIPAGMTSFKVKLFKATPPSAIADNAAWDLTAADRAYYIGSYSVGSATDAGATLVCEADGINKHIMVGNAGLWAYLVTDAAYTPASNSEVLTARALLADV